MGECFRRALSKENRNFLFICNHKHLRRVAGESICGRESALSPLLPLTLIGEDRDEYSTRPIAAIRRHGEAHSKPNCNYRDIIPCQLLLPREPDGDLEGKLDLAMHVSSAKRRHPNETATKESASGPTFGQVGYVCGRFETSTRGRLQGMIRKIPRKYIRLPPNVTEIKVLPYRILCQGKFTQFDDRKHEKP